MLVTGWRKALRSAGERDGRSIAWALFRLGLGGGLWRLFDHPPAAVAQWVGLARALVPYPYCEIIVAVPALWLVVTGAVRLAVMLWGGRRAERIIRRVLQQRNAPMVPARRRR
jgi:hypothetical protein